jgi:hypothetical protein
LTKAAEERGELLQCPQIAASISGETLTQWLKERLLVLVGPQLFEGFPGKI